MVEGLLSKLKPVTDEPELDDVQFGFEKYAENVARFLANDDTPRPFAIAIHGEWGSGKTTFLNEIKRNLINIDKNQKVIEFSSWEYERTDVFASLLEKIAEQFDDHNKNLRKAVVTFGCDVLLRKMAGMSIKDAKNHFNELSKEMKTIKNKLDEMIDENLIIFIDDLDRCNVDNILSMLENIKWFLTVKHVIVVIAVDMDKVENAWELRYNNNTAKGLGRDHMEKMFQLKLSIPHKSEEDLKSYVNKLAKSFGSLDVEFFVKSLPPNPRKIKLALNLLYFTLSNTPESILGPSKTPNSEYLKTLIMWIAVVTHHHPDIATIAKRTPSYLVYAAYACSRFDYLENFRDTVLKNIQLRNEGKNTLLEWNGYPIISSEFMKNKPLVDILRICATSDESAFKTLNHYGRIFGINVQDLDQPHVDEKSKKKFDPYCEILKAIIRNAPI